MDKNMNEDAIRREIIKEKRRKARRRRLIVFLIALCATVAASFPAGKSIGDKLYSEYNKEPVSIFADVPIVNTAKSQIGNKGGEPYWSWYGFSSRVEWCACFASWCENELGYIDEGLAPRFAMVGDGISWFMYRDQWIQYDPEFEDIASPRAGDLIFFDWEQDGVRDHVGIVASINGDLVFTIEGNSSDRCRVKVYDKDDAVIYGYGRIEASDNSTES